MATPKNLSEYFISKGQKLPTVEERRKQYGLGTDYIGAEPQNVSLLQKLMSGTGQEKTIAPATPTLPGLGGEVANRALGTPTAGEAPKTPQDLLTGQLTTALTQYANAPSLIEEKKRLETEQGVLGMKATVGSFEDEVTKTQTLLDELESDITKRTQEYLVSEPQRRRMLAAEQEPLMKQLSTAERGLTGATGRLERTQSDILTELGLIEKEKTTPLDLLEREVSIRSKIKDLTTAKIPNVATSQFNDEGDLTIVTQDPTTGAFSTQTIKGIGKKAGEYENFSTVTNSNGDVTVIGIKRDGTTQNLGVFKGAGKETTDTAFWSVVDKGKTELQQGETWGNVFNRVKAQFPSVPDAKIDNALGVSWKEPGAYQKWVAQKKGTVSNESLVE